MKRLLIYGTGYLDVIKLIDAINRAQPTFEIKGFINDLAQMQGKTFMGYPVLGGKEIIARWVKEKDVLFVNNINARIIDHKKIASVLEENSCGIASLIHPLIDMNYVKVGPGALIPEGCVVGGQAKIGRYFTCRLRSLISHDATVGDFVYMGPGVTCCSFAQIGDDCFIGAGSVISPGVKIGAGSVIRAGSVVVKDIPEGVVAFGSPAKVVRENREGEFYIGGEKRA
jgi:sugar O-acyltransferase (sialic acid O-acetyltransferase NeuD family)